MGAQQDRAAVGRPRNAGQEVAGVGAGLPHARVLLDIEAKRTQVSRDGVGHRALPARRALDLTEANEVADELFALARTRPWRVGNGVHLSEATGSSSV